MKRDEVFQSWKSKVKDKNEGSLRWKKKGRGQGLEVGSAHYDSLTKEYEKPKFKSLRGNFLRHKMPTFYLTVFNLIWF